MKRLVYASSAAVFGGPDKYPAGSLGDDVLLVPSTHYGVFKCCNEGNARIYFQDYGISSVGLRPWTVYGVGRDLGMTSEPTKAIKAVLLGRPYHISFGGWTDFQYVDDVAKTFVQLPRPAVHRGEELQPSRRGGHAGGLPQGARRGAAGGGEAGDLGTTQIAIAYDLSDDGARSATSGRCRRRRWRTASARRWRSSGSCRRGPARHGRPRRPEARPGDRRRRAVICLRMLPRHSACARGNCAFRRPIRRALSIFRVEL